MIFLHQPNYELLEKEVEKRKVALQEAKLKAKGLNPDGTPALSTLGGFSPASKPCKIHNLKLIYTTGYLIGATDAESMLFLLKHSIELTLNLKSKL